MYIPLKLSFDHKSETFWISNSWDYPFKKLSFMNLAFFCKYGFLRLILSSSLAQGFRYARLLKNKPSTKLLL